MIRKKKEKVKDKTKSKERKKIAFAFVLGALIFGTIGVGASTLLYSKDVTYDNSSSGLSATTVQDALDELNEKTKNVPSCDSEGNCTVECPSDKPDYVAISAGYKCIKSAKSTLLENVVTSGSGLYADTYESGRYIYRGQSPSNYITFNGESAGWRIISVESDRTIKIIKEASIGTNTWDAETRTTDEYCKYASYGCNAWGNSLTTFPSTMAYELGSTSYLLPSKEAPLNVYLNTTYYNSLSSTARSKIVSHTFNVGVVEGYFATSAISTLVTREKANKWTGKIALMNITDFMRATTGTSCTSINEGKNSPTACSSNNWMFKSISEWTLSLYSYPGAHFVWIVTSDKIISPEVARDSFGVRPVLHLSSDITLSGSGTSTDPYTIN